MKHEHFEAQETTSSLKTKHELEMGQDGGAVVSTAPHSHDLSAN